MNQLFQLQLPNQKLKELATELGSDCPFFVEGMPQIAQGRGEILTTVEMDLSNLYLALLNPGIHVGTKEAYDGVSVGENIVSIEEIVQKPIDQWNVLLKNDFETSVFLQHPKIQKLKESLYQSGAIYAAMSGSGSSVYGVFTEEKTLIDFQSPHIIYKGKFKNMR